ncbi:hypothetical protein HMPREF1082_01117 [[Clostridium] clostridioforme 90A7]|nr:hypothetical protein HMPREF1082_01117 [[Clostridium] clostridioforme 90A7]
MDLKLNKELHRKLKEKEPDNTYHFWEKEISKCEHNIVEVVEEMLKKLVFLLI